MGRGLLTPEGAKIDVDLGRRGASGSGACVDPLRPLSKKFWFLFVLVCRVNDSPFTTFDFSYFSSSGDQGSKFL